MRVAIIGSGLAGLACARRLADSGLAPVVFDKGRGLGGRLSTRRADGGFQFDHGAQFITAKHDGFAEMLMQAEASGAVGRWLVDSDEPRFVGVPGMTGLAKHLAESLDVHQGIEVKKLNRVREGWKMVWDQGAETFDRVISTAPAPQTAALLGDGHPISEALRAVRMDPCLTLMLALPKGTPRPFVTRRNPDDPISWIALDSTKPRRPEATCWVAQANPDWSRQVLELDLDEVARLMLPLVSRSLGADVPDALYVSAHRWRYAYASKPLGKPFAADTEQTFFAGGDWCLGSRAEAAWISGVAIADALLDTC